MRITNGQTHKSGFAYHSTNNSTIAKRWNQKSVITKGCYFFTSQRCDNSTNFLKKFKDVSHVLKYHFEFSLIWQKMDIPSYFRICICLKCFYPWSKMRLNFRSYLASRNVVPWKVYDSRLKLRHETISALFFSILDSIFLLTFSTAFLTTKVIFLNAQRW